MEPKSKKNDIPDTSGEGLTEEERERIAQKAKRRAMRLLEQMGRTEAQLREKLAQNGYPQDVIEEALAYVSSFGYLNDEAYARSFICGRKDRKSKWELRMLLEQKGVAADVIDLALEEEYDGGDETDAILKLIEKRGYDPARADFKEKGKLMNYLTRKGFRFDDICAALDALEDSAPNA